MQPLRLTPAPRQMLTHLPIPPLLRMLMQPPLPQEIQPLIQVQKPRRLPYLHFRLMR